MSRCLRWTQWHTAWVYNEPVPSEVKLPIFMPLPKRVQRRNWNQPRGSADVPSDRSSACSGDSIINSDKSLVESSETSCSEDDEIEPL